MFNSHKLQYILLLFFGNLFNFLRKFSHSLPSKLLAFIAYKIFKIRSNIVESNLSKAFPVKNIDEIKALAFKNYVSIASTLLEIIRINKMTPDQVKKMMPDKDFDLIRNHYARGKGLIFLTAHFGNWEMGAVTTGIHLNESISVLVKKQKNKYVADWMTAFRQKFGNSEISLGSSVKNLYKAIKLKKMVGIVGDQRGTRDGIKVQFFGQDTYTFPGTAAIALRTGCPVIVLLCARQSDGRYIPVIKEIQHAAFEGTEGEKIQRFNQEYMTFLENCIKEYPDQWFWMHNIWKYNN
jgi:KDO2-lipid IV(A) lauroyltransferase